MITVVKLNTQEHAIIQYQGEELERLSQGIVIQASWTRPTRDLGYTRLEPGDIFIEYFYTNRWYNIFDIMNAHGERKGWYCNIAEPAQIHNDHVQQVDLYLDVWINRKGEPLILDEDEFAADTTLSEERRQGARQGLQALLEMLAARQEVFSTLKNG